MRVSQHTSADVNGLEQRKKTNKKTQTKQQRFWATDTPDFNHNKNPNTIYGDSTVDF